MKNMDKYTVNNSIHSQTNNFVLYTCTVFLNYLKSPKFLSVVVPVTNLKNIVHLRNSSLITFAPLNNKEANEIRNKAANR